MKSTSAERPCFWGPASLGFPAIAVLVALLCIAGASRGVGGDMIGSAFLIYALVALGGVGALGVASAIRAFWKQERALWTATLGLLVNVLLVVVGGFYATLFLR